MEQMLENKIARTRRGIPSSGALPIGRTYNRETDKWRLDQEVARLLQSAARRYLKGETPRGIAHEFKSQGFRMSYQNLITTLTQKCGDEWTVQFNGENPVIFKIPRIFWS